MKRFFPPLALAAGLAGFFSYNSAVLAEGPADAPLRPACEIPAFSAEAPLPRPVQEARLAVWKLTSQTGYGTGFAIGPRHIVTNFHVIWTLSRKGQLEDIKLSQEPGQDSSVSPPSLKPPPKDLKIRKILRLSASLDLALLEASQDMPRYLSLRETPADSGEELFSPGYPQKSFFNIRKTGDSKKFFGLEIFPINHPDLRGASGSPVLDARGQVTGALFSGSQYFLQSAGLEQLKSFIEEEEGVRCPLSEPRWRCFFYALRSLHEKADQGSALSQYRLAAMYGDGLLPIQNAIQESLVWHRRAAAQGFVLSQRSLGDMYFLGKGAERSLEEAARWIREAAERGFAPSRSNLGAMHYNGEGVEKNLKKAFGWYRRAAAQGDPEARYRLGSMYYKGEGAEQNFEEAACLIHLAAAQGHAAAQNRLGKLLYNGKKMKRSLEEAARWFRRAAAQGDPEAQYRLGAMHYRGEGARQSFEEAARWFRRAAAQGDPNAQYSLGVIHYTGKGAEQSFEEAARWFRKAAEQGLASAQYSLGSMYYRGEGVDRDFDLTLHWLRRAAARGHPEATGFLKALEGAKGEE